MSSGFVPAGTSPPPPSDKDAAWASARAAVTAPPSSASAPEDSRSLYEVLQANKARKQEAFEEALKFKNQFKSLDESDVEYLDSVVDSQRREEAARRREVERSLDAFRRLQSEIDRPADIEVQEEVVWGKRKRGPDGRRRKSATVNKKDDQKKEDFRTEQSSAKIEGSAETQSPDESTKESGTDPKSSAKAEGDQPVAPTKKVERSPVQTELPAPKPAVLGLGLDYGSDDDD